MVDGDGDMHPTRSINLIEIQFRDLVRQSDFEGDFDGDEYKDYVEEDEEVGEDAEEEDAFDSGRQRPYDYDNPPRSFLLDDRYDPDIMTKAPVVLRLLMRDRPLHSQRSRPLAVPPALSISHHHANDSSTSAIHALSAESARFLKAQGANPPKPGCSIRPRPRTGLSLPTLPPPPT